MHRHLNTYSILACFVSACLILGLPGQASAAIPPDIAAHDLTVIISPGENSIRAVDDITLNIEARGGFKFTLNKDIAINSVTTHDAPVSFKTKPYDGPDPSGMGLAEMFQYVTIEIPPGSTGFKIRYSGEINDPIEPSKALGRVRGDFTNGIISEDGVFLSSSSGWYPDTENAVAKYRVEVNLPNDWYSVGQGDLLSRKVERYRRVDVWDSDVPYDGFVLVANEFHIRTRNIAGVDCSTYFYKDDIALSDSFLDALEDYMPAYVALFGPFPYSRFDIAENFFSSGYGMPGYTLLGEMVLRMPYATREGSLAHELVHNWWGNYVFPDWENGNWCEGLTYYATNYYWNILGGLNDEALDFRYSDMLNYTLQVTADDEYPVREFVTKRTAADSNIGYSKAGAIFGMLHNYLGDEKFFGALREVIKRRGAKVTGWDDFRDVFEEISGLDLHFFFGSWLDNTGTPEIRIESADQVKTDDGYKLNVKIIQDAEPFHIMARYVVATGDGPVDGKVEFKEQSCEIEITLNSKALSFELDPDYRVFRRLDRSEVRPCLSSTMSADTILVILPGGGGDESLEVRDMSGFIPQMKEKTVKELYEDFADSIVENHPEIVVKYDTEVGEDELKNSSILCFGSPRYNSITGKLAGDVGDPGVVQALDASFSVDRTVYSDEKNSVLITVRNPYNDDYDVTFYLGNSPAAIHKASYIFFYSSYSYVVYESGNAVVKGKWKQGKGPLYYELI